MKKLVRFASLISLVSCVGCASMINQAKKDIKVDTNPSGALVTVYNADDKVVQRAQTPATITLARGDGYFKGAEYRLAIEKSGYERTEVFLKSRITGWYWGNFGLMAGFVLVDPQTGGMWTLYPEDVKLDLSKGQAAASDDSTVPLVLKENSASLPPATRP